MRQEIFAAGIPALFSEDGRAALVIAAELVHCPGCETLMQREYG